MQKAIKLIVHAHETIFAVTCTWLQECWRKFKGKSTRASVCHRATSHLLAHGISTSFGARHDYRLFPSVARSLPCSRRNQTQYMQLAYTSARIINLSGSICQQSPSGSSSCSAPHLDACGQRAVSAVCSRRRSERTHHHQKWCSFLYFMKRYSFAFQRLVEALNATSLSKRTNAPLQIYCYTTRSR